MITSGQLHHIMPQAAAERVEMFVQPLDAAMQEFGITTPERAAMFVAQIAHESGQLQWLVELWGPTEAQKGYEGRKDLGNVFPGDGFKFRGRGLLQTTGRANYKRVGDALGLDLVDQPDLLSEPMAASRSAGWYWETHHCNALADRGLFVAVTKAINGGLNGLEDRETFYARAKEVLK